MPGALGAQAPDPPHRVAALLRRPVWVILIVAMLLLGVTASALAGGRDVLADAQDSRIDGCYTHAEYRDALRLASADEVLYGNTVELIDLARTSRVARPGRDCGEAGTVPRRAVDDPSGSPRGMLAGMALAVGLVAVGAGALAGRPSGRDGA